MWIQFGTAFADFYLILQIGNCYCKLAIVIMNWCVLGNGRIALSDEAR